MSTKNEKQPCGCCGVFHNPQICAQCTAAGCTCKKGEKCRLQANLVSVMQLSDFQVRRELAELRTKYADLLAATTKLETHLVLEKRDVAQVLDAAGVDPNALRGKVSMLAGAAS